MWRIRFLLRVLRPAVLRRWWSELDHPRLASFGDLSLQVFDLRSAPDRDPERLLAQVSAALGLISAAQQGFGELVVDHLKQVIVSPGINLISVNPPVYWGSSAILESSEEPVIACHLIWVATAIRLYRNARRAKRHVDYDGLVKACWEAEERFLQTLPDGDWWIERLRPRNSAA